jgi:hypothetical protein
MQHHNGVRTLFYPASGNWRPLNDQTKLQMCWTVLFLRTTRDLARPRYACNPFGGGDAAGMRQELLALDDQDDGARRGEASSGSVAP